MNKTGLLFDETNNLGEAACQNSPPRVYIDTFALARKAIEQCVSQSEMVRTHIPEAVSATESGLAMLKERADRFTAAAKISFRDAVEEYRGVVDIPPEFFDSPTVDEDTADFEDSDSEVTIIGLEDSDAKVVVKADVQEEKVVKRGGGFNCPHCTKPMGSKFKLASHIKNGCRPAAASRDKKLIAGTRINKRNNAIAASVSTTLSKDAGAVDALFEKLADQDPNALAVKQMKSKLELDRVEREVQREDRLNKDTIPDHLSEVIVPLGDGHSDWGTEEYPIPMDSRFHGLILERIKACLYVGKSTSRTFEAAGSVAGRRALHSSLKAFDASDDNLGLFRALGELIPTFFSQSVEIGLRNVKDELRIKSVEMFLEPKAHIYRSGDRRPYADKHIPQCETPITEYLPFLLVTYYNGSCFITHDARRYGFAEWTASPGPATWRDSVVDECFKPLFIDTNLLLELINRRTLGHFNFAPDVAVERIFRLAENNDRFSESLQVLYGSKSSMYRDTIRIAIAVATGDLDTPTNFR